MSSDEAQIVTWLLVIIGWFLVQRGHQNRETRKETHQRIEAINELVEEIEKNSIRFHTSKYDASISKDILWGINKLWFLVDVLDICNSDTISKMVVKIRKASTLNNFDLSGHKALSEDDDLLHNLTIASLDFIRYLDSTYYGHYHKPFLPKHFCQFKN